jgi:origin recognition complex subunit 3
VREFFLAVKKSPSDLLSQLFSVITPFVASSARKSLDKLQEQLNDLLKTVDGAKGALKSQHDMRSDTLRTTLVAHKVQLSKHKATISEDDAAYSKIVDQFYDWLKEHIDQSLKSTDKVLFAEIFMYDIRGPDKAAFMPKHRFAVERALSSPHDYLNCECCKSNRGQDEDQDQQVNKFLERR